MGHKERAHALFGPSSAHRWLECPGSVLLEKGMPDTASESAAEGTLAHELAEMKVVNYFYPKEISKRKLNAAIKKMKENELWDDEMLGHTDAYIDYIRDTSLGLPSQPRMDAERRWDFGHYMPPGYEGEGYGTADCTMVQGSRLFVIDFKYGKSPAGRVSAERNPQMMLYALGAYEALKMLYPIKEARLAIVQPRLPNGISEWSCSIDELQEFGEHVREQAALAVSGNAGYSPGEDTCRFCRARSRCAARAEHNVKLAFSPELGKKPPLISNGQMGEYLRLGAGVAKWLSELKDCALAECLAGNEVPGWKAVEGRSAREWTDMDAAFAILEKSGVAPEEMLWERKPLTLAQVEKMIGKKDFQDTVGSYVAVRRGKPALVQEADSREAITNKITAEEAFKEEK